MKAINILIASDSFKGSLSSMEVADSMEKGFLKTGYDINVKKLPVADGGEGTVSAVTTALQGVLKEFEVDDVFRKPTKASLGVLNDESIILETASPLGLDKLDKCELDPLSASSYGLGQMILHALDLGAKKIYIGLGGSSTNDGGSGLASALGARLLDENGKSIRDGAIGLKDLKTIDIKNLDPRLNEVEIFLLSDVTNPLCGENGATYIYGPQKGVKDDELDLIDSWMKNYGEILEDLFQKEILNISGSGAAGGLGACLQAFGNAKMSRGIDKILEMIGMEEILKDIDIVFTGEGKMDGQSIFGKAPLGVAKLAKKYNLPVVAIVGSADKSIINVFDEGIDLVLDIINEPMELEYAIKNASELVAVQAHMSLTHYIKWKNIL
ncbi:MAG: glycerate kinase [Tissierellia bacterium]|nr:glycerate kinase [Tissierellia bacterium]